jgi:hypothetical protein
VRTKRNRDSSLWSADVTELPEGYFFASEYIVFSGAFAKKQKSHSLSE